MEFKTLLNDMEMPMESFGVFQVRDKKERQQSVLNAIRAGYRLIDTAASYTNAVLLSFLSLFIRNALRRTSIFGISLSLKKKWQRSVALTEVMLIQLSSTSTLSS